jgi:hypothetical protein
MILGIPSDTTAWKTGFAITGSGDDGIQFASIELRSTDDIDSIQLSFEYGVTGTWGLYGIGEG